MRTSILRDSPLTGFTLRIPQQRSGSVMEITLEKGLYLRYSYLHYYEDPEILFSREWLYTHLAGMGGKIKYMEASFDEEGLSSIPPDVGSSIDNRLRTELGSELRKPQIHLLNIRARVLLLLSNTINRLPESPAPPLPGKRNLHAQTIQQVERRLVQSLEEMLPPQKLLAREFAMSESTLKRHFKAVYGKTLYEYYLEKKMDLAKWLLLEKKISVSETAYMLGYEKVSAFIIIFKKYNKVLPGSLKLKGPGRLPDDLLPDPGLQDAGFLNNWPVKY